MVSEVRAYYCSDAIQRPVVSPWNQKQSNQCFYYFFLYRLREMRIEVCLSAGCRGTILGLRGVVSIDGGAAIQKYAQ